MGQRACFPSVDSTHRDGMNKRRWGIIGKGIGEYIRINPGLWVEAGIKGFNRRCIEFLVMVSIAARRLRNITSRMNSSTPYLIYYLFEAMGKEGRTDGWIIFM